LACKGFQQAQLLFAIIKSYKILAILKSNACYFSSGIDKASNRYSRQPLESKEKLNQSRLNFLYSYSKQSLASAVSTVDFFFDKYKPFF